MAIESEFKNERAGSVGHHGYPAGGRPALETPALLVRATIPAIERLVKDRRYAIESLISIPTKERGIVPFKLNHVQSDYWANRTLHDIILKARQMGFTSIELGEFLMEALCVPNTRVALIAHEDALATRLINIVKSFWESIPEVVIVDGNEVSTVRGFKVGEYSQHVISWPEIGSEIRAGTAGSIKIGRGTALHRVLCTEVGFWDTITADAVLSAVESAMPPGGRIVIESTANGASGVLYDRYNAAKSGDSIYKAHFYGWYRDPSYRYDIDSTEVHEADRISPLIPTPEEEAVILRYNLDESQLRFRRTKQRTLGPLFPQEFAEDDITCFMMSGTTLFDRAAIDSAIPYCRPPLRRIAGAEVWQSPIPGVRYLIGVDVSTGYGVDPSASHANVRKLRLDYSAAVVLNADTLEHVATLYGIWDTKELGTRIVELAKVYNNALLAIESNGPGDSVLNTVVNICGYQNIYYSLSPQTGQVGKWGWWTDPRNKPMMVDEFRSLLESGAFHTWDERLLAQCRTFAKLSPVKVGALPGSHDDLLMAAMIACIVRAAAPRFGSAMLTKRLVPV